MRVYPAIDIKDGKCVRLLQGRFSDVTVYGDNPSETAVKWQELGGEYLHVVDLDGARKGQSANADVIKQICSAVHIPVQTGGGIRTTEDIEYKLSLGVSRVILGTSAVADPEFLKRAADKYKEKIVVGIDAKNSYVAVEGWEKVSGFTAVEFAKKVESIGIQTIVYTDIATDGTLGGPNIAAMKEMVESVNMNVIASGGVGKPGDIEALVPTGVEGVIIGRALYTGSVRLPDALNAAKKSGKTEEG
ncbi:MAG: 1-(5-phosphoribosyl)-5-[(5-phosphoribosylamino)methylideneamino]imidazole-4-carboxamide isomerase [Oscillospiraceae bacterium]|nr:1-(5-phosphoribosyl)-5-[(5-phosphoribosylamino)methylideneamino]imidazole-4-carboxamide isomerase [Oscillospiraceae bacterium]